MSYKEPSRIPMDKPLVRNNAYVDSATVLSEFRNSVWSVCRKEGSLERVIQLFATTSRFSPTGPLFLMASNLVPAKALHTQLCWMTGDPETGSFWNAFHSLKWMVENRTTSSSIQGWSRIARTVRRFFHSTVGMHRRIHTLREDMQKLAILSLTLPTHKVTTNLLITLQLRRALFPNLTQRIRMCRHYEVMRQSHSYCHKHA